MTTYINIKLFKLSSEFRILPSAKSCLIEKILISYLHYEFTRLISIENKYIIID